MAAAMAPPVEPWLSEEKLAARRSQRWLLAGGVTAVLIAIAATALIAFSLSVMAGASAYIVGEGHWSKAQQDSVQRLYRYSVSGDGNDLRHARVALDVPLGDRDARLSLDLVPPQLEDAYAGFARGRNHPDEIPSMIWMYRHFASAPYFRESVAIWRQADEHILELAEVADAMEALWAQDAAGSPAMQALRLRLIELDELLRPLELAFSRSLQEGSRWLRGLLVTVNACAFLLLAALATAMLMRARQRIRLSESQFRAAFRQAGVGMARLGTGNVFIEVNDALCRLLGRSQAELLRRRLGDLLHAEDHDSLATLDLGEAQTLSGQPAAPLELRLLRPDGALIWTRATLSRIRRSGDSRATALLIIEDVSEARRLTDEVAFQASHDALTGLINRRAIESRLQRLLDDARSGNDQHALCFLDLDQFKIVNDTCGHGAGDELLRRLARELPESLRDRDEVGRLGGDEFAVLLERTGRDGALRAAEKLQQALREFVFHWEGRSFNLTGSIGIVAIDRHAVDVSWLLRAADTACYLAKEEGRNCVRVYVESDQVMAQRRGEMEWVGEIRRAIADNRVRLFAQRIEPAAGDDGLRYEVLVRLLDAEGRMCLPGEFLSAAERYGQAPALDRHVIALALAFLAEHPRHLDALALCHVNISAKSIGDEAFRQQVAAMLDASPVPGDKLCFELTETAAVSNLLHARRFMETVRARGCQVAMDDFGSGLSSYGYLKTLSFDILKIDGAFVRDMLDDLVDQAVVRSIREIGTALGKETIAEWVETAAVRSHLAEMGVDSVQGYAVHRPCPIEDLLRPVVNAGDTATTPGSSR